MSVTGNIDFQNASSVEYDENGGNGHVHIALSNEEGVTIGGHMLLGNLIYTTAEITLVDFSNLLFKRTLDDGPNGSGYNELKIESIGF